MPIVTYSGWWIIAPYWLLLCEIFALAWAFRPKKLLDKFDFIAGGWPVRLCGVIIGFSAFVGFVGVFQRGYYSFLTGLGKPWKVAATGHYVDPDLAGNIFGAAVAIALCFLLIEREDKRQNQKAKDAPGEGR